MRRTMRCLSLLVLALSSSVTNGHHASAVFDLQAPLVMVHGAVTDVEWANPHVYLYIDGTGSALGRWEVEGDNVAQTERQCWKRHSVQPGDDVVVLVNPARDPAKRLGHLVRLEKDEQVLWDERSPCTQEPSRYQSASVDGIWSLEPSYVVFEQGAGLPPYNRSGPFSRSHLPLTEAGSETLELYSDDRTATLACTPVTPPLSLIAGGRIAIKANDDTVVIQETNFATTRTVHMNVESHEGAVESFLGHSIGVWDGATLVVDTARFVDHPEGNLIPPPFRMASSDQRRLQERFSLADEGRTLVYRFELSDPVYLTDRVRGERRFKHSPEGAFEPIPSRTENARRFLTY